MPRTMRRPIGAPTAIDSIVAYTDDGVPVTAAERIITTLETGEYMHAAAAAAGIATHTLHDWLNHGATAITKHANGERLNGNEKRYARFAQSVTIAQAEGRARILGAIHGAAIGGAVRRTITKKADATGKVIETTIREEQVPPSVDAATWMAERKWPKDWGRRQQIEVTGEDSGPIHVQHTSVLSEFVAITDAMDRRRAALDTTARELAPSPDVPSTAADVVEQALAVVSDERNTDAPPTDGEDG